MPAQKTPATIIGKAYQKRILNKKAAADPVQTPVPGIGIATNINKKKAPNFSYSFLYLPVLLNNQVKNWSKMVHFLNNSENGLRYLSNNIAGSMFPNIANRNVGNTGKS